MRQDMANVNLLTIVVDSGNYPRLVSGRKLAVLIS